MQSASIGAPTMACPQGWADLPDELLHAVRELLPSVPDLFAFCEVCRPWRDSVLSSRSTYTVSSVLIPPLLLHHSIPESFQRHSRPPPLPDCTWQLIDPTNPANSLYSLIPDATLNEGRFLGSSQGYVITSYDNRCLLTNIFTGHKIMTPPIPSTRCEFLDYGVLTAPPSSSSSSLLICEGCVVWQWQLCSDAWLSHRVPSIVEIVEFKGQLYARCIINKMYIINLQPSFSVEELVVLWGELKSARYYPKSWLVVCNNELLLVCFSPEIPIPMDIRVIRLDLSSELPKWVEVKSLGGWALFLGPGERSPAFSCKNPERWGGRSNCVYHASFNEGWKVLRCGGEVNNISDGDFTLWNRNSIHPTWPRPFWVLPSMFS